MNYLAHIFLAGSDPKAQLGGLLGDFAKPGFHGKFDATISREIHLHRLIDRFTDTHEIVLSAKAKFRPSTRRFAGIILDVLYDHFLATDWENYSAERIELFTARFYRYLLSTDIPLPERLERIAPHMAAQDWLSSYQEYTSVERAVHGLSNRLSQKGDVLIAGLEDAALHTDVFRQGFQTFFPELQQYVHNERQRLEQ
jgi:acyl carrier protein phosphodiesterase